MTIFDLISNIAFTKKKSNLESYDEEAQFIPYMVNRWLSMYSPQLALITNKLNRYIGTFDNKQQLYKLFVATIPKVPFKRIPYIKKKEHKNDENENIFALAKNMELSTREVNTYIDFLKI